MEKSLHQGEIEYNLTTENRARVAAWGWPVVSLGLLGVSQFVPELAYPELAPITTGLIGLASVAALMAKQGQNQLYVTGRILGDIRNAVNSGRIERIRHLAKQDYDSETVVEAMPIIDGDLYLDQVTDNWATHLALLSPTGTGKTRTLSTFLGLYTKKNPCLVVAVEPKDNAWNDLDAPNVLRISAKPTLEQTIKLYGFTNALLAEADRRNNLIMHGGKIDYEILVVLEEYLTIMKMIKSLFPDYHKALIANLKAIENIGRSSGIKVIIVSQSPVAEDLQMSGGERANFRLFLLGNKTNGFEAIERAIMNNQLVSNNATRDKLLAQLARFLDGSNGPLEPEQPLLLSNMIGGWQIVKLNDSPTPKIDSRKVLETLPQLTRVEPGLAATPAYTPQPDYMGADRNTVYAQTTIKLPQVEIDPDSLDYF